MEALLDKLYTGEFTWISYSTICVPIFFAL